MKRYAAIILVFALLLACGALLHHYLQNKVAVAQSSLRAEEKKLAELQHELLALEQDYLQSKTVREALGSETWNKIFTPPQRVVLISFLRQAALNSALADFDLTIEPAQPVVVEQSVPQMEQVGKSDIKLKMNALHDGYVLHFVDDVLLNTPGFVRLKALHMQRSASAAEHGVGAEIDLQWYGVIEEAE